MSFNNFENFRQRITGEATWNPATSNLYGVSISKPKVAQQKYLGTITQREWDDRINLLADEVTVPSRQLTTGEGRTFGAMYRYTTGTTFSEITISFLLTKDLSIRLWFERWMNFTQSDSSNFVLPHEDYTAQLRISKWEAGSNIVVQQKNTEGKVIGQKRLRTCTGNWIVQNAFPFNISTMTFNNAETTLLKCDVSFYYDRYRFDNAGNASSGLAGGTTYIDNSNNALSDYISTVRSRGDVFGSVEYE
jgi:hypothetical protein